MGSYSLSVYITVFYIDVSLIVASANADPSVKWGSTFQLTSGGASLARGSEESGRFFLSRQDAANLQDLCRGDRGDFSWFFQDGKPRRWETLIFSRPTFRSFWSLRVELFVGGSICWANWRIGIPWH